MKLNHFNWAVKTCLLILTILSSSTFGVSQQTTLSGIVVDANKEPLVGATIVAINPIDSTMLGFTLANQDGKFKISKLLPGPIDLQITFIGFGTFGQKLVIEEKQPSIDLGEIVLSTNSELLEEVVVKAEHIPMVIKNDTIEYNSAAFKTKPGAAVEDLLRKLPGVEVANDGTIKAQGKEVQKLTVDGKEFFGDDPTIASKNLPADIVDKVQVFDKKSDLAEFSGIDDGQEQKSINLQLKDGKKKGYFGHLEGGLGTNDRYKGRVNLNRFSGKSQLSLIGSSNNAGEQDFTIGDYINLMGGFKSLISGNGELRLDASEIGNLNNQSGVATTGAGGINFNYEFNKKWDLQSNIFTNISARHIQQEKYQQVLSDIAPYEKYINSDQNQLNRNTRLKLTLKHKIDSLQDLKIRSNSVFNTRDLEQNSNSESIGSMGFLENNNITDRSENTLTFRTSMDAMYRRKFNRPGRVLIANGSLEYGRYELDGLNYGETDFYSDQGTIDTTDILNQQRFHNDSALNYSGSISYTDQLSKGKYLSFSLGRESNQTVRASDYFDIINQNPLFNPLLSNRYNTDYILSEAGLNLRINGKKVNYGLGVNYQFANQRGSIEQTSFELDKNYHHFLPNARLEWELSAQRDLRLNYNTRVNPPTINDLQPNNTSSSPLFEFRGNPNLLPEYVHELGLGYHSFDQFSLTAFFMNLRGEYTRNKITSSQTIDASLKTITQPINVKSHWAGNLDLSFSRPLRSLKTNLSIRTNLRYEQAPVFVNSVKNKVGRLYNQYTVSLDNRNKDHIDIAIGGRIDINNTYFDISDAQNTAYLNQTFFNDFTWYAPKRWIFESHLDFTQYGADQFNESQKTWVWELSISKAFLEKERLLLKISGHDILNQENGLIRQSINNITEEAQSNVVGRYFMFSIKYKLSAFGGNQVQITQARR